jgi:hypothetical protein
LDPLSVIDWPYKALDAGESLCREALVPIAKLYYFPQLMDFFNLLDTY